MKKAAKTAESGPHWRSIVGPLISPPLARYIYASNFELGGPMRRFSLPASIVVAWAMVPAAGCLNRDTKPLNPCTQSGVAESVRVTSVDKVDLLFIIDDSRSMTEEQTSLRAEIPSLVSVLASGDRDGDSTQDFPPVRDLRVGVITTDMGTLGANGCSGVVGVTADAGLGDDGLLQVSPNPDDAGPDAGIPDGGDAGVACDTTPYPKFLSFLPSGTDPGPALAFADDVSCVADVGTRGCGFEQQLEAALKALTESDCTDPWCTFIGDNAGNSIIGHGGPSGANADPGSVGEEAFVREDSLLALVFLTDEEDCSAKDPRLFSTTDPTYGIPENINIRCSTVPGLGFANDPREPVFPISRYVDGFFALRSQSPDLLVYAVIAGVPTDLTVPAPSGMETVSFAQILAAEEMQEVPSTVPVSGVEAGRIVRPSCDVPGRGVAFPPRRFVQVAQELDSRGANAVVQSICQEDFSPAIGAIIEKIADALGGACLPRRLNPDDAGFVECDVLETLPTEGPTTRCDQLQGRTLIETDTATGAEVCRVAQVSGSDTDGSGFVEQDEATGPGWFYDDFTTDVLDRCGDGTQGSGQRISFVRDFEPVTGTQVRLECLQPVINALQNQVDVDSPCPNPGESCVAGGDAPGLPGVTCATDLTCDNETRTFEIVCASDADCPSGFRCDTERTEGIGQICVNPTCG